MTKTQHQDLMIAEQAAKYLGMSRRAFEYWREKTTPPPFVMLGKRRFYPKQQLRDWSVAVRGKEPTPKEGMTA